MTTPKSNSGSGNAKDKENLSIFLKTHVAQSEVFREKNLLFPITQARGIEITEKLQNTTVLKKILNKKKKNLC